MCTYVNDGTHHFGMQICGAGSYVPQNLTFQFILQF